MGICVCINATCPLWLSRPSNNGRVMNRMGNFAPICSSRPTRGIIAHENTARLFRTPLSELARQHAFGRQHDPNFTQPHYPKPCQVHHIHGLMRLLCIDGLYCVWLTAQVAVRPLQIQACSRESILDPPSVRYDRRYVAERALHIPMPGYATRLCHESRPISTSMDLRDHQWGFF